MDKIPLKVLEEIKKHLLNEQKKLQEQLTKLIKEDPFSDTDRLNDNAASDTDAKEEVDHERIEALSDSIKSELESVKSALERVKKGTFGFCLKCRQLIDTDRLAVFPKAQLCIKCHKNSKR